MRAVVCALSAVLLLVGCGVPIQSDPVPLEPGAVPSQLREANRPSSPQPSTTAGSSTVEVNFVRNDKVVRIRRQAPTGGPAERLNSVVSALMSGPSETEQASGITTALPQDLTLTVAKTEGTRVVIELAGATEGRSATENILAVGQIVLSVTALPTVEEVTFSRGGIPVEALLADGALTTNPLTASDFESLRAQ